MATRPSMSSVTCLNCICFLMTCDRVIRLAVQRASISKPYLIFWASLSMVGMEHLPTVDARPNARQTKMEKPMETLTRIFDLTGRVAVITGGNGGIGLGIAQALAAAGCNVSIWGRNPEKNKSAAATMAGCSSKVHTAICDVSDPASVKAAMAATLNSFGRVAGCFANAGIGGGGRHAFIDRTEEQWRTMFATNLDGVFHVFQAAARHMTERATAGDPFGRLGPP